MTKPFLIVGLPRSRTAWMAIAATNAQSICWHEPISRLSRWEDVASIWKSDAYEYTGVSDSSMGLHLPEILSASCPRTLIIERPLNDVLRSLEAARVTGARRYCEVLSKRLAAIEPNELVMRVKYDALADSHVVARCLRWLMPGLGVDMNKLEELKKMNVQADMDAVWRMVEGRRPDLPALFGQDVWDELNSSIAASSVVS